MSAELDIGPILPALVVAVTGVLALLVEAFAKRGERSRTEWLCAAGLVTALFFVLHVPERPPCTACPALVTESVVSDAWARALQALILVVGLLSVPLLTAHFRAIGQGRGEQHALLMFAIVGMLGLVSAVELLSLFVALEIMSVALYALTGMRRAHPASQEAALKYFVTGAFSSAFFLYGIAWLYGLSGGSSLARVAAAVASPLGGRHELALVAAGLLLVGFGFKIASVPFHAWAPDAYQGAPTSVTAFMSTSVKIAAFGAIVRVFHIALMPLSERWAPLVAALAILTMIVGNLAALAQSDLKRMLAYSSIAHAGYVMTALVAQPARAGEAVLVYLAAYAVTNLGAFGVLAALAYGDREPKTLADLAGMGRRRPLLAGAMTVFMLSLTGIPLTAGFIGKLRVFTAAVVSDYAILAIVGLLMSVVSAYYYLRVVVAMYMRAPSEDVTEWFGIELGPAIMLAVCALSVLALGVLPERLLYWAQAAVQTFH